MKKEKVDTQVFISRMPKPMHRQLRFISVYTGMPMQDITNYALEKEILLFKKQIPALKDLMDAENPTKEATEKEMKEEYVEDNEESIQKVETTETIEHN